MALQKDSLSSPLCVLNWCTLSLGELVSAGGEFDVRRGKSVGSGCKASSLLSGWAQEVTWPCRRRVWDGIWLPQD